MSTDSFALHGVGIVHHFGGGVYAKETLIPAGKVLSQHSHLHDHLSILAFGVVRLTTPEGSREISGPTCITIPAGIAHQITALTNVAWYCIHATEDTNSETVDASILSGAAHE